MVTVWAVAGIDFSAVGQPPITPINLAARPASACLRSEERRSRRWALTLIQISTPADEKRPDLNAEFGTPMTTSLAGPRAFRSVPSVSESLSCS